MHDIYIEQLSKHVCMYINLITNSELKIVFVLVIDEIEMGWGINNLLG